MDILKVVYEHKDEPMPEMEGLSDEELISLNVGAFVAGGVTGIIGNASMSVAGAAGETAKVGEIPVIVMADGRQDCGFLKSASGMRMEYIVWGSTMPETMQNLLTEDERAYMNSMIPHGPERTVRSLSSMRRQFPSVPRSPKAGIHCLQNAAGIS